MWLAVGTYLKYKLNDHKPFKMVYCGLSRKTTNNFYFCLFLFLVFNILHPAVSKSKTNDSVKASTNDSSGLKVVLLESSTCVPQHIVPDSDSCCPHDGQCCHVNSSFPPLDWHPPPLSLSLSLQIPTAYMCTQTENISGIFQNKGFSVSPGDLVFGRFV